MLDLKSGSYLEHWRSWQLHTSAPNVGQSSNSPSHTPSFQVITKIITLVLSEEKEKEKQHLNLIVHYLKESQESDPHKRKESDIEVTMELF